jgi:hypothetical protein
MLLCNGLFGYSFSSIAFDRLTKDYPTYSLVYDGDCARSRAFRLGSPHIPILARGTAMDTAIDGCSPWWARPAVAITPGFPDNGGTIMSYCHLQGSVGINLNKGFHPQPLALMKNRIADAQCTDCDRAGRPRPATLLKGVRKTRSLLRSYSTSSPTKRRGKSCRVARLSLLVGRTAKAK